MILGQIHPTHVLKQIPNRYIYTLSSHVAKDISTKNPQTFLVSFIQATKACLEQAQNYFTLLHDKYIHGIPHCWKHPKFSELLGS
jgi:hypothetical protein